MFHYIVKRKNIINVINNYTNTNTNTNTYKDINSS